MKRGVGVSSNICHLQLGYLIYDPGNRVDNTSTETSLSLLKVTLLIWLTIFD